MSATSIPYISPTWFTVTWNFGMLAGMAWFSLQTLHSWHILVMSVFQLGQYINVLANNFDLATPIWASCSLMRNSHLSPMGTTILSCKKTMPLTMCSWNLYGKYVLTSSGKSLLHSWPSLLYHPGKSDHCRVINIHPSDLIPINGISI